MKLTIAHRLYMLVGMFFIGLAAMALFLNYQFSSNLRAQKGAELRSLIDAAVNIAKANDELAKSGKITLKQAQFQAAEAIRAMRYRGKEYFFINNDKGIMIMHAAKPSLEGKNLIGLKDPNGVKIVVEMNNVVQAKGAGFVSYMWPKAGSDEPVNKLSYVKGYKPWNWNIGTGVYMDDMSAVLWSTTQLILLISGVILAVCAAFAYMTLRSILHPIHALKESMVKLANGEQLDAVPAIERTDELGAMAHTVETFRNMTSERVKLGQEQEEHQQSQLSRQQNVEALIEDFRLNVKSELEAVTGDMDAMKETAERLSSLSQSASSRSAQAHGAATDASNNVQTVAAASEEFSASISEINRQVEQATSAVGTAMVTTGNANKQISSLAQAAQQIGDVVSLIREIAEQTNLLALNATIEAARAGEMGKGFAVVAAEVKELSNQTSKATEQISVQISSIQSSTTDAVSAIEEIGSTIDQVNNYTSSISEAIQQQSLATSEISSSVESAAAQTQTVSQDVEAVSSSVEETNGAVMDVESVSSTVSKRAQSLTETVDHFLEKVAAA